MYYIITFIDLIGILPQADFHILRVIFVINLGIVLFGMAIEKQYFKLIILLTTMLFSYDSTEY